MYKLIILFFCLVSVSADTCKNLVDKNILSKIQDAYSKLSSFKSDFSQTSYLDALSTSENSNGSVVYEKPGKMRWDYKSPEEQIFVINNEMYYLYQKEENQVLIDNLKSVLVSEIPVAFLLGVGDLGKDFEILDLKKCGNFVLKLKAIKDPAIKELILEVGNDYLPKIISIIDFNNNRNTINLGSYQKNLKINKDLFEEDFPSGTDINDRRGINE